ncbi:hypothetical protein LWI29_020190 [Acer saccharum]|uniref:Uncharacterized protein n=1 Tax=Acer saccharum TaxID=4024 RepID=A0AA39W2R9_ACESA|nr:hypothetical protein LWI29_020190 [Acer saccharum]
MAVKQEGSVAEFRDSFEVLAATLKGIPDSIFRSAFLNGLREDIRTEVFHLGHDLNNSIATPQRGQFVDSLKLKSRTVGIEGYVFAMMRNLVRVTVVRSVNCRILLAAEESDQEDEVNPIEVFGQGQLLGSVDVSLNSLMGFTSSTTMTLKGMLGSREIIVLVDSGASHSFISTKVVTELGLPLEETDK